VNISNAPNEPDITGFFDPQTNTIGYVVGDPSSGNCAIIDAFADFDYAAGRITYESADKLIEHVKSNDLTVEWIIETHAHADHISAAPYLQQALGGKIGIGEKITLIQNVFGELFDEKEDFKRDGSQFDYLFKENEKYRIGNITAQAISTPGHTPACMSHVVGNNIFVGDTLFMPDSGTARVDFPGGDPGELYRSIKRILSFPNATRLFVCHDYAPNRREILWETTVKEQRSGNIHIRDEITEREFTQMRTARDRTLKMPRLIIPSIQVNIRAGKLPQKDKISGKRFLKIPLNVL